MVQFYIGLGDGGRHILDVQKAVLPLTGPSVSMLLGQGDVTKGVTVTGELSAGSLVADNAVLTPVATITLTGVRADVSLLQTTIDSEVLSVPSVLEHALGITTSFGTGAIFAAPVLAGGLLLAVIPIPTPDLFADLNGGVRPCLPWRVVRMNIGHAYDLTEDGGLTYKIANNQPFVVSGSFNEDPDDPLLLLGGKRNYLGVILDDGMGGKALRFRPPYANEVIYNFDTANPHDTDESGAYVYREETGWEVHRTLPQRALGATRVFDVLDPDRIYDYYAMVLGLVLAQHQYDTKRIGDLIDPSRVPDSFLPLLLRNFGADDIFADEPPGGQAEALRVFVALMKSKGTPSSIEAALSLLGYQGHGSHVWAIPQGDSQVDWTCKPFGFDNVSPDPSQPTTELFPTSAVCIHLNLRDGTPILKISDGVKQAVAAFLRRNVLPAHVYIRAFATDIPAGEDGISLSDSLTITP